MEDPSPKTSESSAGASPDAAPLELSPAPIAGDVNQMSQPGIAAPPLDALPGDAAPTPLIPLAEVQPNPRVTIIRPPAPPAIAPGPKGGTFTLWALIWVAAWAGVMSLTLDHRFDRKFDWNTSYFAIAARNLVHDGFAKLHGGVYLTAGEIHDDFYAGHPPLTAWLLAGWMKFAGTSDAAIRALPLAATALNLLLLFALVKRIFGAPAALAATVVCSLLPMTTVYSQYVNMEPFVLMFILGASLGYLGFARSGSRIGFLFMCICIILGCWTDWPMYIFAGFLGIAHFFHRRDLYSPLPGQAGGEVAAPGFPLFSSLLMIVLPLAVFALFLIYLQFNDSSFGDLRDRAKDRMNGGYGQLLDRIRHPKFWFIDLFTPAALLLAALGAIFWAQWSRRLSLAGGEAGRRAGFRILLCVLLMQLVYTLAFPQGAVIHEFWQYYLIVPLAILSAAFCTWLTVVGGSGRRFSMGFLDRAGWAVVASIPFLALGPTLYRLQIQIMGKPEKVEQGDARLDENYVGALAKLTRPGDIILTDWRQEAPRGSKELGLGYAIPWYTNRTIFPYEGNGKDDHDTRTIEGIKKIAADDKFKGHRILYLWSGDGASALEQDLNQKYAPLYEMGNAFVYLIQGQPDPNWRTTTRQAPIPSPVVPIATKPAIQVTRTPETRPMPRTATQTATQPAKPATAPVSTKPAK